LSSDKKRKPKGYTDILFNLLIWNDFNNIKKIPLAYNCLLSWIILSTNLFKTISNVETGKYITCINWNLIHLNHLCCSLNAKGLLLHTIIYFTRLVFVVFVSFDLNMDMSKIQKISNLRNFKFAKENESSPMLHLLFSKSLFAFQECMH
jgi:hypothetical protein